MRNTVVTNRFKKDYVRCQKQGKDLKRLKEVMELLEAGLPLPAKYKDHPLIGNWAGRRECHIQPDWLLIYKIEEAEEPDKAEALEEGVESEDIEEGTATEAAETLQGDEGALEGDEASEEDEEPAETVIFERTGSHSDLF